MEFTDILSDPRLFTAVSAIIVLFGVAGIAIVAEKIISIWHKVKRNPPIEAALAQLATKPELLRTEAALKEEIVAGEAKLTADLREVDARHIKENAALRTAISKNTSDLHKKIETLNRNIDTEFKSVARTLGRIEGKIEKQ